MPVELDVRDRRIIDLLRADAWMSYIALGQAVNLSPSAAQRRVERLIKAQVIRGAQARIVLSDAQIPLRLFLLIELEDESREGLERFSTSIASHSAVAEAWYTAGETDVLLTLHFADMASYDRFVEMHINASNLVKRFRTLTALRSLTPINK